MPRTLNRYDLGWNDAIKWAIGGFIGAPEHMELTHLEQEGLRLAGILCMQGFIERSKPTVPQLMRKYGISRRTCFHWRHEGCPFERGEPAVLDWLTRRRQVPKRTAAKFAQQLEKRRTSIVLTDLKAEAIALSRELRDLKMGSRSWCKPNVS